MLLERGDVNPNQADTRYGRTLLSWAAEKGNEGIAKMILERGDVNPKQADTTYGRTPLSWAAENGHEGIVKILLERQSQPCRHHIWPDTILVGGWGRASKDSKYHSGAERCPHSNTRL